MKNGKPRVYRRKERPYPRKFPCGCMASTYNKPGGTRLQTAGYSTLMILADGRRVCMCGRFWRCAWVEAKS